MPERPGLPAGYEQKFFSDDEKRGKLRLVASPDGADGSVRIQQDARMFATLLEARPVGDATVAAAARAGCTWSRGSAEVNGQRARGRRRRGHRRRGAALHRLARSQGEVLLFDMTA